MNLTPTEDDILIGQTARRFLSEYNKARHASSEAGHNRELWSKFSLMGWLAMPLSELHGGIHANALTLSILLEAFGYERINEPYAANVIWGLGVLYGIPSKKAEDIISKVADGTNFLAVVDEGISSVKTKDGYYLNGKISLVLGANTATIFLVMAEVEGKKVLFAVPADIAGLSREAINTIDGSDFADLCFNSVLLQDQPLVSGEDVSRHLKWARDRTAALLCADAVGAMSALLEKTSSYTKLREQFGKPLRAFQVVDHFLADMQILVEESRSAMLLAIGNIDAGIEQRCRALAAARVKIGESGRRVAYLAIQLHGAMGVTNELDIGSYVKRLMAFDVTIGTRNKYLEDYIRLLHSDFVLACHAHEQKNEGVPNFCLSPDMLDIKQKMVNILEKYLPADVAMAQRLTTTVFAEPTVSCRWQSALSQHGMAATSWPKEFGGTGWGPEERYIWAHESVSRFAPIISPIGLALVGPVLMNFGTIQQKNRYLPKIIDGSEIWCQGFSEPGAGSDLAALSMRAVREGNEYIITGTKIWTTHAHYAHQMAALVRTGKPGGRRDGISFIIIDMQSIGIQIRPIMTIGGDHEVNQVFFDDVRVPAENLVGEEGKGWEIAKFLLDNERGGEIMSAGHRVLLNELRETAFKYKEKSNGFWHELSKISIDIDVLEVMEIRNLFSLVESRAIASILKLRASEIQQALTELGVTLLGSDLLRWYAERPLYKKISLKPEEAFVSRCLNSRANTIFGGAREIQKSIISKTVI